MNPVELTRIESAQTCAPMVVNRPLDDAKEATKDDQRRRGVSASERHGTDEAIRTAAKLAIDDGDLDRARALLDLLGVKARSASVTPLSIARPIPARKPADRG